MNFLAETQTTFNKCLADMEASQHHLARQQLELENRQRELDNFEATVRQRERDVQEAEAAHAKAKLDRAAAIKRMFKSPNRDTCITNETIAEFLLTSGGVIEVMPKTPYNASMIKDIKKYGLILTTAVWPASTYKTTLKFFFPVVRGMEIIEMQVASPWSSGIQGGHVVMTLTPFNDEWSFFKVTHFSVEKQYPMPDAVFHRREGEKLGKRVSTTTATSL